MNHPITPPAELVKQWIEDWYRSKVKHTEIYTFLATCGAQWGADQELEACCALMDDWGLEESDLRAARRPKPPSLKEQSIALIDRIQAAEEAWEISELDTIRRALEQLDD